MIDFQKALDFENSLRKLVERQGKKFVDYTREGSHKACLRIKESGGYAKFTVEAHPDLKDRDLIDQSLYKSFCKLLGVSEDDFIERMISMRNFAQKLVMNAKQSKTDPDLLEISPRDLGHLCGALIGTCDKLERIYNRKGGAP